MPPIELLTPAQLAHLISVTTSTLKRWRRQRVGPMWYRCGARAVRYRAEDVATWLASACPLPLGTIDKNHPPTLTGIIQVPKDDSVSSTPPHWDFLKHIRPPRA